MLTDALFDDDLATPATPQPMSGKWAAIRIHPDVGTGETLNLGVIFAPARGRPVFRLLPSARPFGVLFGDEGQENVAFLLKVLAEQLAALRTRAGIPSVSSQVSLSAWKFAAGNNPDEIVERLYYQVVTLAKPGGQVEATLDRSTVQTRDLRDRVRKKLNKISQGAMREDPVHLRGRDGQLHAIEMPIWHEPDGLFPQLRFGTLISLHYRAEVYRKAELGPACQYFSTALAARGNASTNSRAMFAALRPPDKTPGFSSADIIAIENEFDMLTWGFQKMPDVDVRMVHSHEEAVHVVQALLQ